LIIVKKIKNELNNPSLKIIATGGLVSLIAPLCEEKFDIIENNLILLGLYKIYLKNI
jgi:pantothenate kinase type III